MPAWAKAAFNVTSVSYACQPPRSLNRRPQRFSGFTSTADPLITGGNADGNISATALLAASLGLNINGAATAGIMADGITGCASAAPAVTTA